MPHIIPRKWNNFCCFLNLGMIFYAILEHSDLTLVSWSGVCSNGEKKSWCNILTELLRLISLKNIGKSANDGQKKGTKVQGSSDYQIGMHNLSRPLKILNIPFISTVDGTLDWLMQTSFEMHCVYNTLFIWHTIKQRSPSRPIYAHRNFKLLRIL